MPRVAKFGGNVRFYESTRTPLEAIKTDSRHKAATLRMSAHKKGGKLLKSAFTKQTSKAIPLNAPVTFFPEQRLWILSMR